jgi:hypothetical protein
MQLKAAAAATGDPASALPPVVRPVERRASFVPRIRTTPHFGGFGAPLFAVDDPTVNDRPAVERSLNPPLGAPRFHRSAVWW